MAAWFFRSADAWAPFRRCDQRRLEQSLEGLEGAAPRRAPVPVNGGRGEVDLQQRLYLDRYANVSCPVRRSIWYRKNELGIEPYEEAEDAEVVSGDREVRAVKSWIGQIEMRESPCSSPGSWFNDVEVHRGFKVESQAGDEEEFLSEEVSHFFILTHGLGEKLSRKMGGGLAHVASDLRSGMQQSLLLLAGYTKTGTAWEPPEDGRPVVRCDVIPLEWWESLHSEDMDARLEDITLPSLGMLRDVANCAISDAIFYMQNRGKLLGTIHVKLEEMVARIKQYNPGFSGGISLVGHSLGGVIFFDLLAAEDLSFRPRALITLGAPTALFLHCAQVNLDAGLSLAKSLQFYNIFHPLDPVAYRLEPLLDRSLRQTPPALIPAAAVGSEFWRWVGLEESAAGSPTASPPRLNGGNRIDWMLQEESMTSTAGALLQAIPSHLCYFKSPDVAMFLCMELCQPNARRRRFRKAHRYENSWEVRKVGVA
ncbi:unnamed protein product [Effrenium voratum]|nr:unnamed protein product [Effrenium voratum]